MTIPGLEMLASREESSGVEIVESIFSSRQLAPTAAEMPRLKSPMSPGVLPVIPAGEDVAKASGMMSECLNAGPPSRRSKRDAESAAVTSAPSPRCSCSMTTKKKCLKAAANYTMNIIIASDGLRVHHVSFLRLYNFTSDA